MAPLLLRYTDSESEPPFRVPDGLNREKILFDVVTLSQMVLFGAGPLVGQKALNFPISVAS